MSNSFLAGQRLTATRMPFQRNWSVSSTSASSAFTTIATTLTSPSATYLAGATYRFEWSGLARSTVAATEVSFEIRDTNTAGTQRMGPRFYTVRATSINYAVDGFIYMANTGGSDITGRVLVLCNTAASSSTVNAGANLPRTFTCTYVGLNADYPEAVAL